MAADPKRKEIQERFRYFLNKCNQKDVDSIAECFTANATLKVDGFPTYKTREEIRQHLRIEMPQYKRFNTDFVTEMFELASDNVAVTSFLVTEEDEQHKLIAAANVTILWKKVGLEWLIDRKMVVFKTKSSQRQYEESAKKEIQLTVDAFLSALNKGDIDTARKMFTKDGIIVSPMNETCIGDTARAEHMRKGAPDWKLISAKTVYFELLNQETAFTDHEMTSTDEQTGKIKYRFREAYTWKKMGGAWFIRLVLYIEDPVY